MTEETRQADIRSLIENLTRFTDGDPCLAASILIWVWSYPDVVQTLCDLEDPVGYLRSFARELNYCGKRRSPNLWAIGAKFYERERVRGGVETALGAVDEKVTGGG